MLVYIIRHGETNENRQGIIQGQMDTQLNDAGRAQAAATGVALKNINLVAAYSSDSARAADTAQAIVAYHPKCQLVLDPRLRERNMGTLSGTKAPARRPLPPSVESSQSINNRLNDFWDNTLLQFFVTQSTTIPTESDYAQLDLVIPPPRPDSYLSTDPAVLLVSHGATISKLVHDVLIRKHGYTTTFNLSHRGIYNTSISIVRLDLKQKVLDKISAAESASEDYPPAESVSVTGELVLFASISHLLKKEEIVKDNADILGQPVS